MATLLRMRLADFDYHLPAERIAQEPVEPRDAARLLVLDRRTGARSHQHFRDLPGLLAPRDLLVLNDTKVFPARLFGRRGTGGKVECFLVRDRGEKGWDALLRAGGRMRAGEVLELAGGALRATLLDKRADGTWRLRLDPEDGVARAIRSAGRVPLPPYIRRDPTPEDALRYQTVFARAEGAVAAPTAGLHFTPEVLASLDRRGVRRAFVTLHVGPGTFRPIEAEDPRAHEMHAEPFEVPDATAELIRGARQGGDRIVACGTTAVRTIETFLRTGERRGETAIYIFPGYAFEGVGALITNFHLPRSTLLLLVAAFAGRELVLDAYREAIDRGYRFYSYGDAMLIL